MIYYFARELQGTPLERIPEGYTFSESANGIVSLVKARPAQILPDEVAAVELAVRHHPKSCNYRVGIKQNRVEVYERVGPEVENLAPIFRGFGLVGPGLTERLQARLVLSGMTKAHLPKCTGVSMITTTYQIRSSCTQDHQVCYKRNT